jgi:ribosomal protein S18 acetylase RimI-like enzyme
MPGYFRMRRDLTAPIVPGTLPETVALVPFDSTNSRACCELMNHVYDTSCGNAPEPIETWWAKLVADPEYDPDVMFVATSDGAVIGFCHCWSVPFVKDLVVHPQFRRRGLGSALLTLAMAAFAARGATSIDLKTDIENKTAQSLYRRLGFVIVERVGG